jgi:hypothetical protein
MIKLNNHRFNRRVIAKLGKRDTQSKTKKLRLLTFDKIVINRLKVAERVENMV